MKKLIFLVLVIIPGYCFSQVQIGVKTGYSLLSNISFKPDIKPTIYTSNTLDFGLVFKHFDNKLAGFQGEIYFTQRGYNAPFEETYNYRRINNYIELPIFFQLHIGLKGFYLHANAGCFAAYLLSSKEGVDTTGSLVMSNIKFNILRDNRMDYGLIGGVGISHEFKWGTIQVEARVLYGFTDLYKYKYPNMPEESKAIAQNVTICYMYNLSKLGAKKKPKDNP